MPECLYYLQIGIWVVGLRFRIRKKLEDLEVALFQGAHLDISRTSGHAHNLGLRFDGDSRAKRGYGFDFDPNWIIGSAIRDERVVDTPGPELAVIC